MAHTINARHRPCRISHDQGVGRYITRDDAAGRYHRKLTDGHTTDNRGVGTDAGTILYDGFDDFPGGIERSRYSIIGERHTRTNEYIVTEPDAAINRHPILHLAAIPDRDFGVYIDIFGQDAVLTNDSILTDLNVNPDLGARTDHRIRRHVGRGMDENIARHQDSDGSRNGIAKNEGARTALKGLAARAGTPLTCRLGV